MLRTYRGLDFVKTSLSCLHICRTGYERIKLSVFGENNVQPFSAPNARIFVRLQKIKHITIRKLVELDLFVLSIIQNYVSQK